MRTVTLKQAGENLKGIIHRVIRDKDETTISSDEGAVVILDEAEWSNIKETLRLLTDKRSLAALLECHVLRDQGERPEAISPEEAFKAERILDAADAHEIRQWIRSLPPGN